MANYAGCRLLALPHKATRCHRSTALYFPPSSSLAWAALQFHYPTPKPTPDLDAFYPSTHQPPLPPQFLQPAGVDDAMPPSYPDCDTATPHSQLPVSAEALRTLDAATPRTWLHLSSASYPAFRGVCSPCGPPRRDANACSHEDSGLADHADEFRFSNVHSSTESLPTAIPAIMLCHRVHI